MRSTLRAVIVSGTTIGFSRPNVTERTVPWERRTSRDTLQSPVHGEAERSGTTGLGAVRRSAARHELVGEVRPGVPATADPLGHRHLEPALFGVRPWSNSHVVLEGDRPSPGDSGWSRSRVFG